MQHRSCHKIDPRVIKKQTTIDHDNNNGVIRGTITKKRNIVALVPIQDDVLEESCVWTASIYHIASPHYAFQL